MARTCVCDEHFEVDENGILCLKGGTTGLREIIYFKTPGVHQFSKGDYPWLSRIRVRVQAAGGGSGGADSDPGEMIVRPGAAAGGYSESLIDVSMLSATETVVVGAGGAGGTGNDPGSPGGVSSFGGLVVANGGDGGSANMPSGTGLNVSNGIAGPFAGTGDFAIGGGSGEGAIRLTGSFGLSGRGGDSMLGTGGFGRSTNGPGTSPRGFGGGAGGATSINGSAQPGQKGGDGVVIIELYA